MVSLITLPVIAAIVVALAEWLHARRIRRIAQLAFGRRGRPAAWVRAVPLLRVASAAAVVLGALLLFRYQPLAAEGSRSARASKQIIICLDVSPSMYSEDAGSQMPRVTRARWAANVLRGVLDRVDTSDTRISVIAFYTKAVPLLIDTYDKEVVANTLSGLPLFSAFESGETNVIVGVNAALEMAKPWARESTTLIVISDGDVNTPMTPGPRPSSIADTLVIGVGDTRHASQVGTHSTRQDAQSLRMLAARLGGVYFDANRSVLSGPILRSLRMVVPKLNTPWSDRELGLLFLGLGALLLALIQPALMWFGDPRSRTPDEALEGIPGLGFATNVDMYQSSAQGAQP